METITGIQSEKWEAIEPYRNYIKSLEVGCWIVAKSIDNYYMANADNGITYRVSQGDLAWD